MLKRLTEDAMRMTTSAFYSLIEAGEQVESMELTTRIDGRPVRCRVEIAEVEQSFSHAIKSTMTTWQEAEDAANAARDEWLDAENAANAAHAEWQEAENAANAAHAEWQDSFDGGDQIDEDRSTYERDVVPNGLRRFQ